MREPADLRSRRPAGASALAVAHEDLLRRCHAAERAGDWQEGVILSALVDVADYLKRIGDNPDSSHYRAEKAWGLLTAAIRLQRDTLLAYGGWPEDDPNEHVVLTPPGYSKTSPSTSGRRCGRPCAPPEASPRPPTDPRAKSSSTRVSSSPAGPPGSDLNEARRHRDLTADASTTNVAAVAVTANRAIGPVRSPCASRAPST
jgi:hypothetical protein